MDTKIDGAIHLESLNVKVIDKFVSFIIVFLGQISKTKSLNTVSLN